MFLLAAGDEPPADPAHLFAVAFQARRAFHHVFRRIFGASLPIAELRAAVWQSVFTREPARYVGLVDAATGSVREASRRTGLDRRVVRRLPGGNGEAESGEGPD